MMKSLPLILLFFTQLNNFKKIFGDIYNPPNTSKGSSKGGSKE